MTKAEIKREIIRLERALAKPHCPTPNMIKSRIDGLKYALEHPYRLAFKRQLSKFLVWLEEKVWSF